MLLRGGVLIVSTTRPGTARTHTRHYFEQDELCMRPDPYAALNTKQVEGKANVVIKQVPAMLFWRFRTNAAQSVKDI